MEHTSRKKITGRRKNLEVDFSNLSQQMYQRNLELAGTNQALSLLRAIDSLVLDSHDELQALCQSIAKTISEQSSYPLVAIMAAPLHKGFLKLMGLATHTQSTIDNASIPVVIDSRQLWLLDGEQQMHFDVSSMKDAEIAKKIGIPIEFITNNREALAVRSVMIVKLLSRRRLVGVLVVGFSQEKTAIVDKDRQLLDRLSEVVGIALDSRLLAEENKRVLHQLQLTNEKLKSLDETKDDFISMASHQLRTPLTSIKGYLSMVLDGDVGEINDTQRQMLGQAFFSSQRMVYLIADLLNVSRIKTGKFLIEPVRVNLADLIEQEIAQLKETAASKEIKLTYNKPKNFPDLMFDETKTRQIAMNYIDNAIYYTPTGGKISVELTNNKLTVEFRVIDNGIGVPRSERQHLFTKFYRAGNARKMRPDGTGLGLFMAKKVVIAQGGAVIFESEEGKGSTFGFVFSKTKLAIKK